ncbi:RES domain-containing protein (plasmid) [Aeromonas media]|uniref:RES domain-containing protein n=1 Tax=Aeromonas media TaxID=651 RepID=A0ABX6NYC8_AERME|nr:RES family NAD+ phosphorylase [Aeromonas media]QJT37031.1 RES domain-containing protein [Aeromonas media]QJT41370.1 RES domain-containing protein [Aeromonas media]
MSTDKKFPQPPENLKVKTETVAAGTKMWRVHHSQFGEAAFNPGFGNARFSPIDNASGEKIPTLYAGESIDVALMESVFHDVPHSGDLKTYSISKFDGQMISELILTDDVLMAKLHGAALRHLGIKEADLIHSDASEYPHTRAWAEKIYASKPEVQGLKWDSKQVGGPAYLFFGDRVAENVFNVSTPGTLLTESPEAVKRIEHLVDEMGVQLVDPDTPDTE